MPGLSLTRQKSAAAPRPAVTVAPMNDPTNPRAVQPHGGSSGRDGTPWRRWLLYAAIVVLAIVALQNSQTVRVKFLTISGSAPLIVALLFAALLGAVIGYAAPVLRRHRREERRADPD